jgi:ketosteroid isomerase-like protein
MPESDILDLNQLAYRYAAAVDARDVDAFLDVFTPDARMRSYHPQAEDPFSELVGHEQLASIPGTMATMFGVTVHQMTNHLVEIDGDRASGSVLCTARHLSHDPADHSAWVVVIQYVDRYERRDGRWRITDREIRFLWNERHEVVVSPV